jgi:hypothetical protein
VNDSSWATQPTVCRLFLENNGIRLTFAARKLVGGHESADYSAPRLVTVMQAVTARQF